MANDEYAKLLNYVSQRFDALETRLDTAATQTDIERLERTLDGVATMLDDDEIERQALSAQLGRHEAWVAEAASHGRLRPYPQGTASPGSAADSITSPSSRPYLAPRISNQSDHCRLRDAVAMSDRMTRLSSAVLVNDGLDLLPPESETNGVYARLLRIGNLAPLLMGLKCDDT